MSAFDRSVVAAAEEAVRSIVGAMLAMKGQGAVVGEAPAGAGKSYAVGTAVGAAVRAGLRVAVATPTNEQAYALIEGLAGRMPRTSVTFIPAKDKEWQGALPNVRQLHPRDADAAPLIVGTLSKLGDAFGREDLSPRDVLLVDEAFQANSVQYFAVAGLADRHVLMGDRGQLAPFSTAPGGDWWRGLDEDPLLTAVEVLKRNCPQRTKVVQLPVSRRLDPRAVKVARSFYPTHAFDAAVLPGVRGLGFARAGAASRFDRALDCAAKGGWAHVELPGMASSLADRKTIDWLVGLVERLFARGPWVRCEREPRPVPLERHQVAVAVSHNDQKSLLRAALDEAGFEAVVVDTANKLQGLTFEVVLAWHPLAGLTDVDEFHLDPGRLCVMLTRHRQACIVVGREADRRLVQGRIPIASPAWAGWDGNPVLDGWNAHEAVFDALKGYRMAGG